MPNIKNIEYTDQLSNCQSLTFEGFFVNWRKTPNVQILDILAKSTYFVVAKDHNQTIGFITALSDQILSAYTPFLEVLPKYQAMGIGTQLVNKILQKTKDLYMVDLVCDPELNKFYKKFDFKAHNASIIRNIAKL